MASRISAGDRVQGRLWPVALIVAGAVGLVAFDLAQAYLGNAWRLAVLPAEVAVAALALHRLQDPGAPRRERVLAGPVALVGAGTAVATVFIFLFQQVVGYLLGHSGWTYF